MILVGLPNLYGNDEPFKEQLNNGRVLTIVGAIPNGMVEIKDPMPLLIYNFATLFGLYHFAGYETLVSDRNFNTSLKLSSLIPVLVVDSSVAFNRTARDLDYFRKWGVSWYILDKKVMLGDSTVLKPFYSDDKRVILYDSEAKPFVFWMDCVSHKGIKHTFSTNSVSVLTERETQGQLIVNVLYNSFFCATIDGTPSELFETGDKQMAVLVPSGRHIVKVTYKDPYFIIGLYISLGFMSFLGIGWLFRFARGITTDIGLQ